MRFYSKNQKVILKSNRYIGHAFYKDHIYIFDSSQGSKHCVIRNYMGKRFMVNYSDIKPLRHSWLQRIFAGAQKVLSLFSVSSTLALGLVLLNGCTATVRKTYCRTVEPGLEICRVSHPARHLRCIFRLDRGYYTHRTRTFRCGGLL